MSNFIIFEDEDDNWKGSEVMRLFVDNYMQAKGSLSSVKSEDVPPESIVSDNKTQVDNKPAGLDVRLAMQSEVNNILYQLNDLARESNDAGNEKATMMIEVAALKIKDLLNGDDDEI